MHCLTDVGVEIQREDYVVPRLQWLDNDLEILVASCEYCRCLAQELVNGLKMMQHNALVGEVKSMSITIQSPFMLNALAVVIGKSGSDRSIHKCQ